MPGEWRQEPFSSAVLINPPVRLKRGCEYPFVSMDAIGPGSRWVYASRQRAYEGGGSRFQDGDTLLARITPCLENGKIARFKASGYISVAHGSTELIVIRGRAGVTDTGFAYYLTQSPLVRGYAISQMTGTSGRQRVPIEAFEHLLVPIPPLPEQRAIAHILGTLDDKIELNRRMNETLEAMAQAMFKSWFIDFDPVHAKAEGRAPGLPADVAALFPDSFEDSELGQIPKGWTVRSLGELVSAVKGCTYASDDLVDSDTALVTLKSFARGGGYRSDGLKSFAGPYKAEQVVTPGEIVIACTDVTQAAAIIGRTAMVHGTAAYRTLVASLDTIIIRPNSQKTTRSFLYCLGRTDEFVSHTYSHTTGTTVLHLAKEAVPSFVLALPPPQPLMRFDSLAEPILSLIRASVEQSETIAALRDAMLPKLLSGELRADDVGDVTAASG